MDEAWIREVLSKVPGSKRAAHSVIIPGPDGESFHLQGVIPKDEMAGLTSDEAFFCAFCSKTEILRIRQLRSAHDYLLHLRAKAIVDSARAVRVMRARKRMFEQKGRPWSLSEYYHSMDRSRKAYVECLSRANAKKVRSIPAGLAYVFEANAVCINSLLGDVIVAAESLEQFYYFMTIAFLGENCGVEWADRASAVLIAMRIMNGAESLDFDLDSRGTLPREAEQRVESLVASLMQFTFGHEYAHILCGHLTVSERSFTAMPESAGRAEVASYRTYSHDTEYQADVHAVKNVRHDAKAYSRLAHGAFLALFYLHALQELKQRVGLKKLPDSGTHPAPLDRIRHLFPKLGIGALAEERMLARYIGVLNELQQALDDVMSHSRGDILTFYGSVYLPSYKGERQRDRYDY